MKIVKQSLKYLRHGLKKCILWSHVHIRAPLRNSWRARSGNCHVTVLRYHRISNENSDDITVMPSQFFEQLSILKRHYDIIDMKAFISEAGCLRNKTAVVISFDDGYQDNYDAAKILRMESVPVSFYVSNGITETKNPSPIDTQFNSALPALYWRQVKEMVVWGLHIDHRSIDHCETENNPVQCSLNATRKAAQDVAPEREGKDRGRWFAFGQPRNMKNATAEQLDDVDLDDCDSACGGVNQKKFNRYDIARQAVNHQSSELAFRALVEGYLIR